MSPTIERRKSRRADTEAPVPIELRDGNSAPPVIGQVKNISLAGALCHVQAPCALKPGDEVICSCSLPREGARGFPFQRILGKGRVVRVEAVAGGRRAGETPSEQDLVAVAIAFAPDVTALATIA